MSTQLKVTVAEVEALTPLVKRFRFEAADKTPLPVFSGGAHITVSMQDGARLRHNAYSLISDPYDGSGYEIAVRRDDQGRGGSKFMHEQIAVGDTLTISVPANLFQLDLRARKHILIGGGIGITPFVAQLRQLDMIGAPYELHYAAHSRDEAAGLALLPQADNILIHVSQDGTRMDLGRILADQPIGTHVYTCGPETLISAVAAEAAAKGWPASAVHSEAFTAPPPGEPFEVTIGSTGQTVQVGADQTLLEALEEAGVPINWSCRGGACGQCETSVTTCDGDIEHNDHWLSEADRAAARAIMPCMSRFRGDHLVLDL
ncbi:MAG: PDR/VanB family oxidoreductase [Marinibacterium sp.]|nr:PDR/VanB family oxidoreductase [Marinibacterium sp.]